MIKEIEHAFNEFYIKGLPVGLYKTIIQKSNRFDSGWELTLYKDEKWHSLWWCEKVNDGWSFELEKEYGSYRMDITIGFDSLHFTVYTDKEKEREKFPWPEYGHNVIESKVEDYCNKHFIQSIREQLAESILSGKIDINIYCNDTDCYDCPPSKIGKQIIPI